MRITNEGNKGKKIKLQSHISVITRERITIASKLSGITVTKAISQLIHEEYQKLELKED